MKIEIPDPKFKHGQRVFFLKEERTEYGVQHRCTSCDQLHYTEKYMPLVIECVVAGCTNWNVSSCDGGEPQVKGPFYQVDDQRRGMGQYGANESQLFSSYEEAQAAQRNPEYRVEFR
jgi:hypothetical protein